MQVEKLLKLVVFGLRGYYTYPQLARFMFYLKIIDIFLEKKMFKELKNSIEMLVGQAVIKLWIKYQSKVVWIDNSRTAWPT